MIKCFSLEVTHITTMQNTLAGANHTGPANTRGGTILPRITKGENEKYLTNSAKDENRCLKIVVSTLEPLLNKVLFLRTTKRLE